MKLYQLFLNVEVQGAYKVVYYDFEQDKRIEVKPGEYTGKDIAYLLRTCGILRG